MSSASRPFPFLLLGLALVLLAPVSYLIQLKLGYLGMPWQVPGLATAGVVLTAISAQRNKSFLRALSFLGSTAICALLWYFVLHFSIVPTYKGPAQVGQKFPPFHAKLADGSNFDNTALASGTPSVVHFFRGRW